MAGHIRHVPIILNGCDLVDHGSIPGVGAEGGRSTVRPLMVKETTSTGFLAQAFLRKVVSLLAILVLAVAVAVIDFLNILFFEKIIF